MIKTQLFICISFQKCIESIFIVHRCNMLTTELVACMYNIHDFININTTGIGLIPRIGSAALWCRKVDVGLARVPEAEDLQK